MFKKLFCCVKKLCLDWMILLERCRDLYYEIVSFCLNFIDFVCFVLLVFIKWKLLWIMLRVFFWEDFVLDFEICCIILKGYFFFFSCFYFGFLKVVYFWNEKFGIFKILFYFLKWLKSCKIKFCIFFCCSKWWICI